MYLLPWQSFCWILCRFIFLEALDVNQTAYLNDTRTPNVTNQTSRNVTSQTSNVTDQTSNVTIQTSSLIWTSMTNQTNVTGKTTETFFIMNKTLEKTVANLKDSDKVNSVTKSKPTSPYEQVIEDDPAMERVFRELCTKKTNCGHMHTMCHYPKPGPGYKGYKPMALKDEDIAIIIHYFNYRRNLLAGGREYKLSPASDMLILEWDATLALFAQRWADQCLYDPLMFTDTHQTGLRDFCRDHPEYQVAQVPIRINGEGSASLMPALTLLMNTISSSNINISNHVIYTGYVPTDDFGAVAFYSGADKIGCGISSFLVDPRSSRVDVRRLTVMYCNIGPVDGLYLLDRYYRMGKPCSACPPGTRCYADSYFNHLCQRDNIMEENEEVGNTESNDGSTRWSREWELADGLRLVEVRIDKHVVRGNATVLECRFDLQGETLYSVKWYKDGHEFYRYVPQDTPPAQLFPLPGVHVRLDRSNETQVALGSLDLPSSGRYRCEVSAEAPSFQTVSDHGDMQVVALPEEGPRIQGGKPRYQAGDLVRVNCTSGRSKPAATLSWYINGEQAVGSYLRGPFMRHEGRDGLIKTTLGLEFRVERRHFRRGDLKLRCIANIAAVYYNSNEESVEGDRQQRPPALEVKDNQPHSSDALSHNEKSASALFGLLMTSLVICCLKNTFR